jgi:hypothetical protein
MNQMIDRTMNPTNQRPNRTVMATALAAAPRVWHSDADNPVQTGVMFNAATTHAIERAVQITMAHPICLIRARPS